MKGFVEEYLGIYFVFDDVTGSFGDAELVGIDESMVGGLEIGSVLPLTINSGVVKDGDDDDGGGAWA